MKMTRILTPLALAVSAMVGAQQALAGPSGYAPPMPSGPAPIYEAGTVVFRLGGAYVDPDDTSVNLRNPDIFPEFQGLSVDLDSEWSWQFSAMVMPIDHFGIEYQYDGESGHSHDITFNQFGEEVLRRKIDNKDLDRTTQLLTLNWFPVCKESWIQPYVGFGAVYTDFDSVNTSEVINEFLADNADAIGPARYSISDSWGWTGQVGVDIILGRESNWLVNAAVRYDDVDLDSSLTYAVEGLTQDDPQETRTFLNSVRSEFDPDPWVWTVGVGYKF
ncbi:OmpW/AlkL family protein [Microbulbifer guangxiensis]|uniref:OmpW/AlkL family protein n=1 Tax=Microbulbifer guangxiensis TaxID=2904249 RepID=UPI001F186602|nr:OmpW family outer membrane protein [Microbulbifer guangxiensis]